MAQDGEVPQRVKPDLGGGFRDYLPKAMLQRQRLVAIIQTVFERYGFLPLMTPAIEREEVLTGGDASFSKSIFRLGRGGGEDERGLALRFDLTVPLARVVAAYPQDVVLPFRRYQVAQVWRAEKPQKGRYREFGQFDADIVGSASMMADAEVIAMMSEVMRALVGTGFIIRVNNRKILNALPTFAGFSAGRIDDVLRVLDKLDKIGWPAVVAELQRQPDNAFDEAALALPDDAVAAIRRFLDLRGQGHEEVLDEVQKLIGDIPIGAEGIEELRQVVDFVRSLGVPDVFWQIDLSIARGLGYYTGPVFETYILGAEQLGSVYSGGRYDGLVNRFSPAQYPATGASVGVDRLFAILEELGRLPHCRASVTEALIAVQDETLLHYYLELARTLRSMGIRTEVYMGDERSLKVQLGYAAKLEIPFVVICGQRERDTGTVQLKDMAARTQAAIPVDELADVLTNLLAGSRLPT